MSTATSVTPATLEAPSGPRRGQSYSSPSRTQSTRSRPSAAPSSPVRANSTYSRPPPSRVEEVLPQRDYDTINTAQSTKRRSTDRPPMVRVESSKSTSSHHRSSSRSHHYQPSDVSGTTAGPSHHHHHHHHYHQPSDTSGTTAVVSQQHHHHQPSDISGTTAVVSQQHHHYQPAEISGTTATPNGGGPAPIVVPIESRHTGSSGRLGRSRTTIPAQSGNWVLGKTIGAGSMGEVKLARKVDGGEQVSEAKGNRIMLQETLIVRCRLP
jgi:hypothetical protein